MVLGPAPRPMPLGFSGSSAEWLVYSTLIKLGKRPDVDFTYQSQDTGRIELGGLAVPFLFTDPPQLAIRLMGNALMYTPGARRQTALSRAMLVSQGLTVIDLDERDVERDPDYYVRAALRLEAKSRSYI